MQSLAFPRNSSSHVKDEGLAVAAAVLAAVMPRAIMSAHFIAELNTADLLSAGRAHVVGWGGLDIVGDMLMDSQLMGISDDHFGFPDAITSIQVRSLVFLFNFFVVRLFKCFSYIYVFGLH